MSAELKKPPESFSEVELYIREKYLAGDGTPAGPDAERLVQRKAARMASRAGWGEALKHAERFVMTFYEHIIPAITSSTKRESVLNVLRAAEHGGSPPNMPEIVNGFELLLMVLFLDNEVVEEIWSSNQLQRRATL